MSSVTPRHSPDKLICAKRGLGLIPGKASDYLRHVDELKRGDRVIIWARESTRMQKHHLREQVASLRREAVRRGLVVVAVVKRVGSGWDSFELIPAVEMVKKLGAVGLLFESPSRVLRDRDYHSVERPDPQPTDADWCWLKRITGDCPLFSLLHPDCSPAEERAVQAKRGGVGRPRLTLPGFKKKRKEELKPEAIRLRQEGFSLRAICSSLRVRKSTVEDWIREDGAERAMEFSWIGN
jgi:hypothetical protein